MINHLRWNKKVNFNIVKILIGIIKFIVSHSIYKYIKYIFNILLLFEGILVVIYYIPLPIDIINFYDINKSVIEIYKNVLRYIRDTLNYLLGETDNLMELPIEKEKSNVPKDNTIWMFSIITIVIISGIVIYYNPEILNYFKDNNNDSNSDLLGSSIPNSPTASDYFKDPESPIKSNDYVKDLSDLTPKATSLKILPSDNINSDN